MFAFRPIGHESSSALSAFLHTFKENVATLKLLGVDDLADFILFFVSSRVLDPTTRQLFEPSVCQSTILSFYTLIDFVQSRLRILENIQGVDKISTRPNKFSKPTTSKLALTAASHPVQKSKGSSLSNLPKSNKPGHCSICNRGEHFAFRCFEFLSYSIPQRREIVKANKLCFSCMSPLHFVE